MYDVTQRLPHHFTKSLEDAAEARGQARGELRGRAQGMMIGEIEGRVRALLVVLEARGLQISEDYRIKIESCVDNYQLTAWIVHAITAETADEVFGEVI
ncbi:hypothetical protein [Nonomuraea jiangxiensis]|uniref:DUF4351 domain-containing protein n=1 Tax=Nonomuraea jiangxiensis TaxID=633440 RepID=A0A1G8HEB0_9ACTN|nr:hypothetical protein [Nonomuraea jiangxiensis]SDI04939.1 hypothetical protein SAMN05421869_104144 [Nonomuraea jiangxiensis]